MIKFSKQPRLTKMIKKSDPDFLIKDGFTMIPRAGFEISMSCPYNYRSVIQECVANGWLNPVAHVRDYELTYEKLCEE
jgi:hypothetical protein